MMNHADFEAVSSMDPQNIHRIGTVPCSLEIVTRVFSDPNIRSKSLRIPISGRRGGPTEVRAPS